MTTRRVGNGIFSSSRWQNVVFAIVVGLVVIWSGTSIDIDLSLVGGSADRMIAFLQRMFPPDWSVLPTVLNAALETFHIALLGTIGAVLASVVLGALAADLFTPRFVHMPVKWLLAAIRSVPLILVAMLLVGAVGLGPLPGILAIAFHSTGMLAKFYAEAIENVPRQPLEALDSSGATLLQKLRFGAWPHMAPDILRDTMFRFELNIRESLVLGLVGAGGIGLYIQLYVRAFQYDKAATLTIVTIAFILLIEAANYWGRTRLQ